VHSDAPEAQNGPGASRRGRSWFWESLQHSPISHEPEEADALAWTQKRKGRQPVVHCTILHRPGAEALDRRAVADTDTPNALTNATAPCGSCVNDAFLC
jgi:hypothetical protein